MCGGACQHANDAPERFKSRCDAAWLAGATATILNEGIAAGIADDPYVDALIYAASVVAVEFSTQPCRMIDILTMQHAWFNYGGNDFDGKERADQRRERDRRKYARAAQ